MTLRYSAAPDVQALASEMVQLLELHHIDLARVHFLRSTGSKARWTQARIHGLSHVWFHALRLPVHYVIEVISERFDYVTHAEREQILLHELMHIPRAFSGGFVTHRGRISTDRVVALHAEFERRREKRAEQPSGPGTR